MKALLIFILLLIIHKIGFTEDMLAGKVFRVPGWQWVDVIPSRTVSSGTCGIDFGDQVKVLATEGSTALVQFQGQTAMTGGTSCLTGITFLINTDELKKFTYDYQAVVKKKRERRALINRIMIKARKGKKK